MESPDRGAAERVVNSLGTAEKTRSVQRRTRRAVALADTADGQEESRWGANCGMDDGPRCPTATSPPIQQAGPESTSASEELAMRA
ncbi:hypothetical protein GCM10010359_48510 [Streptomyces morookaense]|nr:hypothetical protein GCM10010359_48510 [Streptomyces morookaense]